MARSPGKNPRTGGEGPAGRTHATLSMEDRQSAFLLAFGVHGNISGAARVAGIARETVYRWKEGLPDFAGRFAAAREDFGDRLEEEALRRAVEGVERHVTSAGRLVVNEDGAPLLERVYSDSLLSQMLKAHRRDLYGDRTAIEHSGEVRTIQGLLSDLPEASG